MSTDFFSLDTPVSAVIFDCDGTLSAIEGIDELAKDNHVSDIVQRLTQDAMSKTGLSLGLYQERLNLVKPTHQQLINVGHQYIDHRVPDIGNVISLLQRLNKAIYIVSAGLSPSVKMLGDFLNIPSDHIFAVDIDFDEQGHYVDFNQQSPLVNRNGKRIIVDMIQLKHTRTAYIGDGLNDLEVNDLVTRFVGYGGIYYRKNIESACEYYIKSASMSALLPLVLTEQEVQQLTANEKDLFSAGLQTLLLK